MSEKNGLIFKMSINFIHILTKFGVFNCVECIIHTDGWLRFFVVS